MPYEIGTNSVLQIQFEGRHAGQQVMNIMTYVYDGEAVTEDGPLVIDEIEGLINPANKLFDRWLQCLSADVVNCLRYYQWIHPIRYAYIIKGQLANAQGGGDAPSMPPNISQAVTRQTNFAGREEVSTLKLPGVPLGAVVDGFLTDPQMALLNDFATESCKVITLGSGSKMVPIPWNRTNPGTANQLINSYAHSTARTMHRRTVGLGT